MSHHTRRLATGAALLCAVLAVPTTGAALGDTAGNAVPVTQPDQVTVIAGTGRPVHAVANDTDDADDLAVCRAKGTSTTHAVVSSGDVVVLAGEATGDDEVRYQACDHSYLVPGTISVHTVAKQPVTVHKVADQPGVLRIHNANDVAVRVLWGNEKAQRPDGRVKVGPDSSADITVHRTKIVWVALAAYDDTGFGLLDIGRVKGIVLPASGRAATSPRPSAALDRVWRDQVAGRGTAPARRTPAVAAADAAAWPEDPTTVAPPTAQPDTVRWWAGSIGRVRVLANDTDPTGARLDVCRTDGIDPKGPVLAFPLGRQLLVFTNPGVASKKTFTYYACNSGRLAAARLRVVTRRADPLRVHAMSGRPGFVSVRNRNPASVVFQAANGRNNTLAVRVPAHSTREVRVPWHRLDWQGSIGRQGGDAGQGTLIGIQQPS